VHPEEGAVAVIQGPLTPGLIDFELAVDGLVSGETVYDRLGSAIVSLGDVDEDGREDALVGAAQAGTTLEDDDPGAAYILTNLGDATSDLVTVSPLTTLWGDKAQDWTGENVVVMDVNGDGDQDLWISAAHRDGPELNAGTVFLVLGPIPPGSIELADDADLILTGDETAAYFGRGLGPAGDVDSDGLDDVLIGAPDASGGSGHVMLLQGADLPL